MRKEKPKYKGLAISLLLSVLMTGAGMLWIGSMTPAMVYEQLVIPLARLSVLIGAGLAMARAIEAKGWTQRLGVIARPLFSYANLGPRCSAAFTTAFFSGVSANAMLVDFHNDGKITRKQMFLANFINQLPAYFLHLPTTFFVVVSITRTAGVLYFALTFAAVVLRTMVFSVYGRFFVQPAEGKKKTKEEKTGETREEWASGVADLPETKRQTNPESVWLAVRNTLPHRYAGILLYVIPIYVVITLVTALGAFDALRDAMAETLRMEFVPVEALSVVVLSFVAEFTSGFAAAGALLERGAITVKETVLALVAGNILAFPVRALRHQVPRYMGIFTPKTGLQILLLGQLFRIVSLFAVAAVYYVLA